MKISFELKKKKQMQIDREKLRKLGYIQELDRSVGVFSNFALSFSVISVLTGLPFLYGSGLKGKGEYELWAWFLVGIFQLIMAFSLAEITSCYPVAGGVYEWTNILGNNRIGWFNGWISLIGWLACTTGINYGVSEFIVELLGIRDVSKILILFICLFIILSQTIICSFGIKKITKINNLSVGVHIIGVVAISALLLIFSGSGIDLGQLSLKTTLLNSNVKDYIPALLMATWTLTAFDASASISEECINPTKIVPYGMILSVVISIIFGGILLFSFGQGSIILENINNTDGKISLFIIGNILGPTVSKFLSLILFMAMFACGLAAQTVTVRIIFAFSRNNGLPLSAIWKSVPRKHGTPIYSIILCGILEIILIIFVLILERDVAVRDIPIKALPIITSLSTVGIYFSYAVISLLALLKRKKIDLDKGDFYLGKFGYAFNSISFLWAFLIGLIMLFYYDISITIVFLVLIIFLIIYYFTCMRKILDFNYKKLSENELLRIENMRGIE